jgi:hypothetical protein
MIADQFLSLLGHLTDMLQPGLMLDLPLEAIILYLLKELHLPQGRLKSTDRT